MHNYELSPRARKNVRASEMKRKTYWPKISKAETLLILERPLRFNWGGRKAFADYVHKKLPLFSFNSKLNQWEGPLTLEAWEQIVDRFTLAKELQVRLGEGIEIWVDCAKTAKRAHEEMERAGGPVAHALQTNADHYRQQAAKVRGRLRQYYLKLALESEERRNRLFSGAEKA